MIMQLSAETESAGPLAMDRVKDEYEEFKENNNNNNNNGELLINLFRFL